MKIVFVEASIKELEEAVKISANMAQAIDAFMAPQLLKKRRQKP